MTMSRLSRYGRFTVITGCIWFQIIIFSQIASANAMIMGIRHWSSPSSARVVLDLPEAVAFETFCLDGPPRVVVDLEGVSGSKAPEVIIIRGTLVDQIRLGRYSPRVMRLVLDLKQTGLKYDAFLLPPTHGRLFRLVIDIENPEMTRRFKEERQAVQKTKAGGTRVVVVDPGHGGEDPGGMGRRGTKEKDVVLAIAKVFKERLDLLPDMQACLTRNGDYFLSLRNRLEIAQDYGGGLFVSIHTDASPRRRLRGASVYCLSYEGATDEAARILAERENAADLVGGVRLNQDRNLNAILLDLAQTQTINESLNLGGIVLQEFKKVHRLKFTSPRQAGFGVLKAPDIPSVLVEVGFISNPTEERLLMNSGFHHSVARSLENAIRQFLCQQKWFAPNQSTPRFCQETPQRIHVVQPGQNLSRIASLYHTTIREIQKLNKIKDASRIYPGQKILVP